MTLAPNFTLRAWVLSHLVITAIFLLATFQVFNILNNNLKVNILNVGQGDAILIQTPEYKNILIDAGEGSDVIDELGKELGFFNNTIDLFVLTHPHLDHFGGFFEIVNKYKIKNVMLTGVTSHNPLYQEMLKQIKESNIHIIFPVNNKDIQIGTNTYLDILFPFEGQSLLGKEIKNLNNSSVVIRLTDKNKSLVMLTGDAEHELEREILLFGQDVQSGILKLGHHGSRTATSSSFLNAVNPNIAIISAGIDNKFEHPHEETLEQIKDIKILSTMSNEEIEFIW